MSAHPHTSMSSMGGGGAAENAGRPGYYESGVFSLFFSCEFLHHLASISSLSGSPVPVQEEKF